MSSNFFNFHGVTLKISESPYCIENYIKKGFILVVNSINRDQQWSKFHVNIKTAVEAMVDDSVVVN